jgi:2,3-bisphosphoglycerate-independent phosphoglycerate mutase
VNASLLQPLLLENPSKIVLLVLDGLGDLPHAGHGGRTPLEAARTPNLDALAPLASQGRLVPVAPGITPGSGPGHLGLFGYDPIETPVGRGVLEALGAGIALERGDVAARANFCTVDAHGVVTDRRAGRIPTEMCVRLVERLKQGAARFDDVEVVLQAGKGHRFVAVFRGAGLGGEVSDADPHKEGKPVPDAHPLEAGAANEKTARVVNAFTRRAAELLSNATPANAVLARGLSARPHLPGYRERFGLRAAAIAAYPMYRGVAQLAGMEVFVPGGEGAAEAFAEAQARWKDFDFLFIHVKGTDMAGEDGNFEAKVAVVEQADAALPELLALAPDVLCVTGDHSTPVSMQGHSWHPVPALVAARTAFADGYPRFHEKAARAGSIGTLASRDLMAVLLAHAGRLDKYGA